LGAHTIEVKAIDRFGKVSQSSSTVHIEPTKKAN